MSNSEEFGCWCFNPFGCYAVRKPRKPKPNQCGYRQIRQIMCKNIYEGETKDNGLIRKPHGHGKLIFEDKDYVQGDWEEDKIKQNRTIKKIPLNNAENIFLQNIEDSEIDKEYFTQQNTKKNKSYIDITKGEKVPQGNTNKKDHLKIIYSDHGIEDFRELEKPICDLPNANGRKSYYISSASCHGAFVDPDDNNLIDKIKEKIKGTNTIGFFSHVDKQYSIVYKTSIDKDGRIGTKRAFTSKQEVDVNDEDFNTHKDEFFHYYCILNEGNEQNIYQIPHELCYWREVLIDDKKTSNPQKYPNKFIEAVDCLKEGRSFKFTTRAQVEVDGKLEEQDAEIEISGEMKEVEVITHDVIFPEIKVVQSEYQSESQSINNISSTYNNKNNNINKSNISDIDDEIKEINNANNENSVDELDDDEIKALDEKNEENKDNSQINNISSPYTKQLEKQKKEFNGNNININQNEENKNNSNNPESDNIDISQKEDNNIEENDKKKGKEADETKLLQNSHVNHKTLTNTTENKPQSSRFCGMFNWCNCGFHIEEGNMNLDMSNRQVLDANNLNANSQNIVF